ncbi:hypothetical protein FRX54_03615, partial [Streptococcus sp. sy004]
ARIKLSFKFDAQFSLTYCLLTGYFHNPHLVRLIQFSKVLTSPLRRQLLHSIKLYIPCQLLCQKKN